VSDLKVRILKAVQPDLDAIETALAKNLNPHLDLVRDVAGHILFSGGKRLRPLLMVLSPDGKLLNSKKDAASWRNVASRSEDDIFRYFATLEPAS